MNADHFRRLLIVAFVSVLSLCSSFASAQPFPLLPTKLDVVVGYRSELGAAPYEIQIRAGVASGNLTLTAPDGTEFKDKGFFTPFVVSGLTSIELTNRFVGTWKIADKTGVFPSDPIHQHEFTISDFALANLPTVPSLISPPDGATLPAEFDVIHTGTGYELLGSNIGSQSPGSGTHVDWSEYPAYLPTSVTAWATSSNIISLGDSIPLDPSWFRKISVSLVETSFSPPRTWTVGVPEPTASVVGIVGMIGIVAFRDRKKLSG